MEAQNPEETGTVEQKDTTPSIAETSTSNGKAPDVDKAETVSTTETSPEEKTEQPDAESMEKETAPVKLASEPVKSIPKETSDISKPESEKRLSFTFDIISQEERKVSRFLLC